MVELCEGLKSENNQLKTGYEKVGKDTQFFTTKLREMMSLLESGEKEKKELIDEMQGMTDLNNRMKEELDKKNTYLKNFAEGLESVKSNVEQERARNEGISEHIETLNKQLEIRDSENSKLLAFADISKQTIDQMEKKI
jgi:chromosome segregation ATPase